MSFGCRCLKKRSQSKLNLVITKAKLYSSLVALNFRFMGNYDELEGGQFENSALYLSGGIHQEYKTMDTLLASKNANDMKPNDNLKPNIDELFDIIRIALSKNDMVGCVLENVNL